MIIFRKRLIVIGEGFMDYREQVLAELKRRGWSVYRLAVELDGQVAKTTIYAWCRGETRLSDDRLAAVFEVLGFRVKRC